MERFFKIFDIYGSEFNLKINGQTKFRSVIGGFMSIITMAVFIWTVMSFGRDFYLRENPKITIGDGIYTDEKIPILQGSDYQEKFVVLTYERDFDKIIRPFISYQVNSNTTEFMYIQQCSLDLLINKSLISGPDDINYQLYTYYCVRMNDYILGGLASSPKSHNSYPLYFMWDQCENISEDDSVNYNITTCDKNFNSTLDSMNLMVWYEKIGFSPNSKSPFVKKLSFTNYFLFNDKMSFLYFPINVYELKDDIGWISNTIDESYDFNFAQSFLIPHPEYDKKSRFPKANIIVYISDNYRLFSRTYQKLQDLLATIGGFMKLVFTVLSIFNTLIRLYLIDNFILDKVFDDYDVLHASSSQKISQRNSIHASNKDLAGRHRINSALRIESERDSITCPKTQTKGPIKSDNYVNLRSASIKSTLNSISPKKYSKKIEMDSTQKLNTPNGARKSEIFSFSRKSVLENENLNKNICKNIIGKNSLTKKNKSRIDYCTYVKIIIYNSFNRKFDTKSDDGKKLEDMRNKIIVSDRIRDFSYIIDKMTEIDIMKTILLNDSQALSLKYLQKPRDLSEIETSNRFSPILNSDEINVSQLNNYFLKLINENELKGYDQFLFDSLDENIKEKIKNKSKPI